MAYPVNLTICLEYDSSNDGHVALDERLQEIARGMDLAMDVAWKHPEEAAGDIATAQGVIVPNGPTPSFEGQILCCKTARESRIPLLGICGGLQAAAVDVARHLAGLPEANSVEYVPTTSVPVVHEDGQPCVRTPQAIRLVPGGYLADMYGSEAIEGTVRCGRFVNREYWLVLRRAGLELLATSVGGERILGFGLGGHRFYLGVAFLPQLNVALGRPEPLLASFLQVSSRGTGPVRSIG
jgi:CTP synthase